MTDRTGNIISDTPLIITMNHKPQQDGKMSTAKDRSEVTIHVIHESAMLGGREYWRIIRSPENGASFDVASVYDEGDAELIATSLRTPQPSTSNGAIEALEAAVNLTELNPRNYCHDDVEDQQGQIVELFKLASSALAALREEQPTAQEPSVPMLTVGQAMEVASIFIEAGYGPRVFQDRLDSLRRALTAKATNTSVFHELIKAGDAMHFEITKQYSAERAELAARWITAKATTKP